MKKELINIIKYSGNIDVARKILFDIYDKLSDYEFDKNEDIRYELKNIVETLEYLIDDIESFIDKEK